MVILCPDLLNLPQFISRALENLETGYARAQPDSWSVDKITLLVVIGYYANAALSKQRPLINNCFELEKKKKKKYLERRKKNPH